MRTNHYLQAHPVLLMNAHCHRQALPVLPTKSHRHHQAHPALPMNAHCHRQAHPVLLMKAYNFRQLHLAGSAVNSNQHHPCKVLNKGVDIAGPEEILVLLPNLPQASAGKSMAKSTVQVPMSGGQIGNGILQRRSLRGK